MVFHIFSTSEKPKGHINVWQQSAVLSCFFGCFCLIKNACIIFTSHVLTVDAREKRHRHHSDTDTWLRNPKQPPGMVIKPYEMLGYPTNLNWWSPDFFSHQPVQSMAWKKNKRSICRPFFQKKWFILLNSFHLEILRDGSGKFLRTDICQRCRESPPTNHHQIRQMHPKRLPIFWSFKLETMLLSFPFRDNSFWASQAASTPPDLSKVAGSVVKDPQSLSSTL